MEVKGTAVASLPKFIKTSFGEEGYQKWLNSLSDTAKDIYSRNVLPSSWYPLEQMFTEPTKAVCDVFYNGSVQGAKDAGRYSADYGLQGILKVFVKVGSPSFIIKRASSILPSYYKPSKIDVINTDTKRVDLRISEFPAYNDIIENRIIGWIERALEISGCKEVSIDVPKSKTRSDGYTDLIITWR